MMILSDGLVKPFLNPSAFCHITMSACNLEDVVAAAPLTEGVEDVLRERNNLDESQQCLFDEIVNNLQQQNDDPDFDPHPTFGTGPGGVGKSHLLRLIMRYAHAAGYTAQVWAPTGIAAHLVGGVQYHYAMRIPVISQSSGQSDDAYFMELYARTKNNYAKKYRAHYGQRKRANTTNQSNNSAENANGPVDYDVPPLKDIDLLIIEEVSQMSAVFYRLLITMLQQFGKSTRKKTGGLVLLLIGDFFQLPPVGENVPYAFQAREWNEMPPRVFMLDKNWRQSSDGDWYSLLSRIRVGEMTGTDIKMLNARLHAPCRTIKGVEPTTLYFAREAVERVNSRATAALVEKGARSITAQTSCSIFASTTSNGAQTLVLRCTVQEAKRRLGDMSQFDFEVREALGKHIEQDAQSFLSNTCICVGSQVMLTRNLNTKAGLVNGTRGCVVDIVESPTQDAEDTEIKVQLLDPRTLEPMADQLVVRTMRVETEYRMRGRKFAVQLVGFPLMLASAMTVYKSQGQTLPFVKVGIHWNHRVNGAAYVALGRCPSTRGLFLTQFSSDCVTASPLVKSFYKSLRNGELATFIDTRTTTTTTTTSSTFAATSQTVSAKSASSTLKRTGSQVVATPTTPCGVKPINTFFERKPSHATGKQAGTATQNVRMVVEVVDVGASCSSFASYMSGASSSPSVSSSSSSSSSLSPPSSSSSIQLIQDNTVAEQALWNSVVTSNGSAPVLFAPPVLATTTTTTATMQTSTTNKTPSLIERRRSFNSAFCATGNGDGGNSDVAVHIMCFGGAISDERFASGMRQLLEWLHAKQHSDTIHKFVLSRDRRNMANNKVRSWLASKASGDIGTHASTVNVENVAGDYNSAATHSMREQNILANCSVLAVFYQHNENASTATSTTTQPQPQPQQKERDGLYPVNCMLRQARSLGNIAVFSSTI